MSDIREEVRQRYAEAAISVTEGPAGSTSCGEGRCCGPDGERFGPELYGAMQLDGLPDAAVLGSLGCGNPTAVAELREGETVLDLGAGGGLDVLLSAKRVGPTGRAYGLDM